MIKAVLNLKQPLLYINRNTTNAEYLQIFFKEVDWFILTELKKIFEIFIKASIKLQGEVYTTLPKALLYIYQIYNKLTAIYRNYQI